MSLAIDDLRKYCEELKIKKEQELKKQKEEAEKIGSEMTEDILLDLSN